MSSKTYFATITLGTLLSACVSAPINPLASTANSKVEIQPQCLIDYETVCSTEIVVKSTDKNKKTGDTTQEYSCKPAR